MAETKKIALVTGGSSGIGLGIALRLAHDGLDVVITGRDEGRLRAACEKIGRGAAWIVADVSRRAEIARLADAILERHPVIDVLINNAGIMKTTSLETEADELERIWDETFNINLKGMMFVTHALSPLLRAPGGRVVNMSSIAGQTGGTVAGMLGYSASKAGVNGLTLALAREFAPRGITVNAVAPGMIDETGLTGTFDEARRARTKGMIPLGRPGLPAEIASAVSWLVSEGGGYVTGSIVSVNGGWRFG